MPSCLTLSNMRYAYRAFNVPSIGCLMSCIASGKAQRGALTPLAHAPSANTIRVLFKPVDILCTTAFVVIHMCSRAAAPCSGHNAHMLQSHYGPGELNPALCVIALAHAVAP